jgi:hypothetical protein
MKIRADAIAAIAAGAYLLHRIDRRSGGTRRPRLRPSCLGTSSSRTRCGSRRGRSGSTRRRRPFGPGSSRMAAVRVASWWDAHPPRDLCRAVLLRRNARLLGCASRRERAGLAPVVPASRIDRATAQDDLGCESSPGERVGELQEGSWRVEASDPDRGASTAPERQLAGGVADRCDLVERECHSPAAVARQENVQQPQLELPGTPGAVTFVPPDCIAPSAHAPTVLARARRHIRIGSQYSCGKAARFL